MITAARGRRRCSHSRLQIWRPGGRRFYTVGKELFKKTQGREASPCQVFFGKEQHAGQLQPYPIRKFRFFRMVGPLIYAHRFLPFQGGQQGQPRGGQIVLRPQPGKPLLFGARGNSFGSCCGRLTVCSAASMDGCSRTGPAPARIVILIPLFPGNIRFRQIQRQVIPAAHGRRGHDGIHLVALVCRISVRTAICALKPPPMTLTPAERVSMQGASDPDKNGYWSLSRKKSYIMMAPATAAFSDSAPPTMGIFRRMVASRMTAGEMPWPSLPITMQILSLDAGRL